MGAAQNKQGQVQVNPPPGAAKPGAQQQQPPAQVKPNAAQPQPPAQVKPNPTLPQPQVPAQPVKPPAQNSVPQQQQQQQPQIQKTPTSVQQNPQQQQLQQQQQVNQQPSPVPSNNNNPPPTVKPRHPLDDGDEEGEEELDDELLQTVGGISGQRNTFVGNTVRDPSKQVPSASIDPLKKDPNLPPPNSNLQRSDPGLVVNRFKDSIDNAPGFGGKQSQAPSQAQVQTVIDSYQQQMKDFKQSINDINGKMAPSAEGALTQGPVTEYEATVRIGTHYFSQQEESEYQHTMGQNDPNYISTFRTEMMTKGGATGPIGVQPPGRQSEPPNNQRPPSIVISNAQTGIDAQNSLQGSVNPLSQQTRQPISQYKQLPQDAMASIQTLGGKESLGGLGLGADQSYQPSMQESQRSAGMDMAPYTSTFPDFRQDSRPSFNVDFRQDPKHMTQGPQTASYDQSQTQYQSTQQDQTIRQSTYGAQTMHQQNFRQDTKPFQNQPTPQQSYQQSIGGQASYHQQNTGPGGPQSQYSGPPQSQQQYQQSQYSQGGAPSYHQSMDPNNQQQSYRDSQKFRDSNQQPYQQSDGRFSSIKQELQQPYQQSSNKQTSLHPTTQQNQAYQSAQDSYKQSSIKREPLQHYVPVPRDQLLTQEQKAMLQLGQKDEKMQRKLDQPLLTQLMLNKGGEDEDELGGYYDFDGSLAKPESIGIGRNFQKSTQNQSEPKVEQQQESVQQTTIHSAQMDQAHTTIGGSDTQNITKQSMHSHSDKKNITMDELAYLKEQFQENEERERLNPQNVLVRVIFIHAFNSQTDAEQAAHEEATTDRKLYSFFIPKTAKIQDLKDRFIKKEFGFDIDQQKMYFKYKELQNQQAIMDIEHFDIEEDILMCITINGPKILINAILREALEDIKIADVRLINTRDPGLQQRVDPSVNFELDKFDVDQDKLPWPLYRDWTAEAAYLSNIIVRDKTILLSDEQAFLLQQGFTKHLQQNAELAELAEAEAAFRKLCEDFKKAALYSVHLIVKKNPTPLNLYNLYGDDGDKYVVGGILIRRAKDWTICGQPFTEASRMHTTAIGSSGGAATDSNLLEISGKIAALDVRNLATLRNRIARLVVPLACIVDYYGLRFECQSLAPLSINSLVYGSDNNGLTFTNKDEHAEVMARQIASLLNLKPHYIEEQATLKLKLSYLPYTVQIHRNKDLQEDFNLYLVNPFRLFAQDESLRQPSQIVVPIQEILGKQLRPELILANNKGEPDSECQYFTWRKPTKCDECSEWINDYEYYYYEKKSVDKSQRLLVSYHCCIGCYVERLPTEKFKYPVNKIVKKELQAKDRLQFYQNMNTGRKFMDMQFQKVPLNPDAYFHLSNGKDKADKISEQEEILRAAQKLKDEVIGKVIEDLNNVEEDPLTGEQLERILHSRGINMRTMGKICSLAELNHIRELCVIEVISRSAKLLIRDGLTFLADDEEAGFQSQNIKKCVLHYLLEIFNVDDGSQSTAQSIWDFITEHARKKYAITVEKEVLSKINLMSLFISLTRKLNLRLRKPFREIDFYSVNPDTGARNFLAIDDIEHIAPSVKDYTDKQPALTIKEEVFPTSLNIVLESARTKDSQGKRSQWYMRGGEEREEATELYRLAASICEQVLGNKCVMYAKVLKEFAEHMESRHQEKGRPENSRWNKSFAIPEDDLSSEARFFYSTALSTLRDINADFSVEAAEINVALARLVKPRNSQFSGYRGESSAGDADVYLHLMQAVDIYELVLGFDHPETADAYTKMAIAYQEQGNFSAASPWIRRAFTVFFKCFGPHDPITQSAYEQLKSIETNIDSKLDQVPFEELPLVIFEIEKQQKILADQQLQYQQLGVLRQIGGY